MPEINFIEQLRRQLVMRGCPMRQVRRLVREIDEHREDLTQVALVEGLSQAEAEARATAELGDPQHLAEQLTAALRRSSWWGRHFMVAFGLLPFLAFPMAWLILLIFELSLEFALGYGWSKERLHAAANNPTTFHQLAVAFRFMDYLAIALAALLFCWLARRAAVSFSWMTMACIICSFCALITWGRIEPYTFTVGFTVNSSWDRQWIRAAIPLLVAGAIYVFHRRLSRGFRENAPA